MRMIFAIGFFEYQLEGNRRGNLPIQRELILQQGYVIDGKEHHDVFVADVAHGLGPAFCPGGLCFPFVGTHAMFFAPYRCRCGGGANPVHAPLNFSLGVDVKHGHVGDSAPVSIHRDQGYDATGRGRPSGNRGKT